MVHCELFLILERFDQQSVAVWLRDLIVRSPVAKQQRKSPHRGRILPAMGKMHSTLFIPFVQVGFLLEIPSKEMQTLSEIKEPEVKTVEPGLKKFKDQRNSKNCSAFHKMLLFYNPCA